MVDEIMLKDDILIKLVLIRYILIPKQLRGFDYGYGKDSFDYNVFFSQRNDLALSQALHFKAKVTEVLCAKNTYGYRYKSKLLIDFFYSLPFVNVSVLADIDEYNPFDDFDKGDLDNYFLDNNFDYIFNFDDDEASIFYSNDTYFYYKWFNDIENKSLIKFIDLYIGLIRRLSKSKGSDSIDRDD